MNQHPQLLVVAALLERAYRLALVLQTDELLVRENRQFIAGELIEILDEARVSMLSSNAE